MVEEKEVLRRVRIVLLIGMMCGGMCLVTHAADKPMVKAAKLAPATLTKVVLKRDALESPKGMVFFETTALKARSDLIERIGTEQKMSLTPKVMGEEKLYQEKSAGAEKPITRMISMEKKGHLRVFPRLETMVKVKQVLLPKDQALKAAEKFIIAQKLLPSDGSVVEPKSMMTLSNTSVTADGKSTTVDVLQTVVFQRSMDKKPVMGLGSQLVVDLADRGNVVGLNRTWNALKKSALKPEFRTDAEVYDAIDALIKERLPGAQKVSVEKPRLVYYGNDTKYVQPAYFFTAVISGDNVENSYFAGIVAAAKNAPEEVMPPIGDMSEKPAAARLSPSASQKGAFKVPPDDPTVGRYVVREDSSHWVGDANDFKRGLTIGHPSGYPAITFGDYYWAQPYMWTSSENNYVDKWNITLMEGHGAHWLFTTRSNCCDTVNLNSSTQPGYGNVSGNSMRYLILKGCSIVPSPAERADWYAPWYRVFKGLRQAVGFRTTMYINDNISDNFGFYLALNCRVLDSWFAATNSSSSYAWNRFWGASVTGYGAVVMIPGHEGDGIYSVSAAPPATSTGLTIWWQH